MSTPETILSEIDPGEAVSHLAETAKSVGWKLVCAQFAQARDEMLTKWLDVKVTPDPEEAERLRQLNYRLSEYEPGAMLQLLQDNYRAAASRGSPKLPTNL